MNESVRQDQDEWHPGWSPWCPLVILFIVGSAVQAYVEHGVGREFKIWTIGGLVAFPFYLETMVGWFRKARGVK